jgi:hypothetical protein
MKKSNILNFSYLLFFVIYPILALRQANIIYVNFSVILRSLVLILIFTGLAWLLLRWILKDWHKAGILTTAGMLLFFSYGHVYLWAADQTFGPLRHRTMIIAFILIFVAIAVFLITRKSITGFVRFLNITGAVLTTLILVQSVTYAFQVRQASRAARESRTQNVVAGSINELPDIYLIILDEYTRSDVLLETYQYDNSAFLSSLEEMGFYVADCSLSNYPRTNLSLTSMMNMDYYYNLFDQIQVLPPLGDSTVSETLRELGYSVVSFENWVGAHFELFEDVLLSGNTLVLENIALGGGINEFESMLIETSFLRIFVDMPQYLPGFMTLDIKDAEFYEHFKQTHFILDQLKILPTMPGPKFVLAHIIAPHDPYIFTPNGTYQSSNGLEPFEGYRNNVSFIDNFLPESIQAIIDNSDTSPIIIIMGDHGPTRGVPSREDRLSILNAYYLGEEINQILYPNITPVNSFRIIFNAYFETQYPLLEDHSYYFLEPSRLLDQRAKIINHCQP